MRYRVKRQKKSTAEKPKRKIHFPFKCQKLHKQQKTEKPKENRKKPHHLGNIFSLSHSLWVFLS